MLNKVTQRNVSLSVTFATCTSEHLPKQNHTGGKDTDIWMKCDHDNYITTHALTSWQFSSHVPTLVFGNCQFLQCFS